jgi:hypothetical protein
MNVNTVPEDRAKEIEPQEWNRLILEWEQEENKRNPLPPSARPDVRDRQEYVPKSIETYLKNRFGSDIEISFGSRFGNPDDSGYSYEIYQRKNDNLTHLAKMSSDRVTLHMLPPGYTGRLAEGFKKVQERNRLLTKDSRPEEFRPTLWVMNESPRAQKMHAAQMKFFENLKFEPLAPPAK